MNPDAAPGQVRVDGQVILNNIFQVRDAAIEGLGLAHIPEDLARPYLSKGHLVWVLELLAEFLFYALATGPRSPPEWIPGHCAAAT